MKIDIRKCTFAEIENSDGFDALVREYQDEALIHDLAPPAEKFAAYRVLEGTKMFHPYGAFDGDMLVGIIFLLLPVLPHYGITIAIAESFFVCENYRKYGAGLRLLRAAMRQAKAEKSPGILVSAPTGGKLAEVLSKMRHFKETNRVFLWKFAG
jgi:GNAT superfamily N-acetyltransferase